jgi:hypothetical protein
VSHSKVYHDARYRNAMPDESESRKDALQVGAESAADHLGRIATIITAAVRDIAQEIGDWANEALDARDTRDKRAGSE